MARYYCEYCNSYLTHDTLSVRKSHLIGKNHLKIRADYYKNKYVEDAKNHDKSKNNKNSNKKVKYLSKLRSSSDSKKNHGKKNKIIIHHLNNKEKKIKFKNDMKNLKELNQLKNVNDENKNMMPLLSTVYNESPGYSKIFISSNRFDIGESIRRSKLPQRANFFNKQQDSLASSSTNNTKMVRDRNEIFNQNKRNYNTTNINDENNNLSTMLPPPKILTDWSNTIPKQSIFNDSKNYYNQINYSKRKINEEYVSSKFKRRKY